MFNKLVLAALACALAAPALAQVPGQTIRAKDGDVILLENNDKVKIVRRRHANLRILHNAEQRWIVVLADWLSVPGGGDGRVDWSYSFRDLAGTWPLGERWEGAAYLDEYTTGGPGPSGGVGVTTTSGLIQILNSIPSAGNLVADKSFADPSAMAVMVFRGSGGSMEQAAFDVAEQRALARLAQENAGNAVNIGPGNMRSSVRMSASVVEAAPGAAGYPPPTAPVRVGSNIRTPAKIKDARPVLPDAARRAGVYGMVILEIVIGADGKVETAKVLRSIPLLDQAAIDAVKQWVYEPTLLNGQPVPIIMTATVNFTQ